MSECYMYGVHDTQVFVMEPSPVVVNL